MDVQALAKLIETRAAGQDRFIVALAGPPAAGKSTLAANLAARLGGRVVPMDGFHFDDAVLASRGLASRKGSPPTFDAMGFLHLMRRLRMGEEEVAIPIFDRDLELSRAGADVVTRRDRILIVEGNYLLLDEAPWRDLGLLFDLTVFLEVPEPELIRRLTARWQRHGRESQAAQAWITSNDLPNARIVMQNSRPAEITLRLD